MNKKPRSINRRIRQVKDKMPMVFYLTVFIFAVNCITAIFMFFAYLGISKIDIRPELNIGWIVLIILIASIVLSTFLVRGLGNRIIFRSIRQIIDASKAVAAGDFTQRLAEPREKEIAEICTSFNEMVSILGNNELLARDFISNVSHQFRTPLASIHGYAQLLESDDITDAERLEYIDIIEEKSISLTEMINDILELSRLEHLSSAITKENFSLDEQIYKCIISFDDKLKEKGLEVDLDIVPAKYCGNQELLAEVWKNLIENAIKFSNENDTITVKIENNFEDVKVSVSDNGIGMSLETQMHIFDRFYRGKEAHGFQGTGLGLSMVKSIIDKHEGFIEVYSEAGKGTKFVVTLPIE